MAYRFRTPPELLVSEQEQPALEACWQRYGTRPYFPPALEEGFVRLSDARKWAARCEADHCDVLVAAGSRRTVDTARLAAGLAAHAPAVVAVPSEDPGGVLLPTAACVDDGDGAGGCLCLREVPLPAAVMAVPVPGGWARTGLQALARAIDALTAPGAFPMTDSRALAAVQSVFEYLPLLTGGELHPDGEIHLLTASLEAGLAASNALASRLFLLGAPLQWYGLVPPGWAEAVALHAWVCPAGRGRFSPAPDPHTAAVYAALGRRIGSLSAETPDFVAAEVFRKALDDLCRLCGLPSVRETVTAPDGTELPDGKRERAEALADLAKTLAAGGSGERMPEGEERERETAFFGLLSGPGPSGR